MSKDCCLLLCFKLKHDYHKIESIEYSHGSRLSKKELKGINKKLKDDGKTPYISLSIFEDILGCEGRDLFIKFKNMEETIILNIYNKTQNGEDLLFDSIHLC